MVADAGPEPVGLFDELEGGGMAVEFEPDDHRDDEFDQRDDQRDPAGVARHGLVGTAGQQNRGRAGQREEGDDAEDMAQKEAHGALPAIMNQVISAATPISMAKA